MTRRISDPEVLKGLAQPVRQKLLRLLTQIGPATGATLCQRLGLDPGHASYHLRELAKRGFIEDVPELATDRRERWWRAVPGSFSWSTLDFPAPDDRAIGNAVKAQQVIDEFERLRHYEQSTTTWAVDWQDAAVSTESFLRLTPGELRELSDDLHEVLRRYAASHRDKPVGGPRQHVFLFFHAFPERP